jgi:Flp pilus assembly protein TadG
MRQLKDETGAALIEFVIILIPFLILLFASIEFGVAGYNKAMITNASREGARAGIVFDASETGNRISNADIAQIAQNYCASNLITFGATATPVITITRAGSTPGDDLTVSVTYNYGFLVLQNLIPGFNSSINLAAVSIMRME